MELNPAVMKIVDGAEQLNTLLERDFERFDSIHIRRVGDGFVARLRHDDASSCPESETQPTVLLALLSLAEKIKCGT